MQWEWLSLGTISVDDLNVHRPIRVSRLFIDKFVQNLRDDIVRLITEVDCPCPALTHSMDGALDLPPQDVTQITSCVVRGFLFLRELSLICFTAVLYRRQSG